MSDALTIENVMVTGATGFVGRSVVRELLARGFKPVCVVRSPDRLYRQHPDVDPQRLVAITGSLSDRRALRQAADMSQAVIHLVGIIIERRLKGRTFERVHVRGTRAVVDATTSARVSRFIHMSALGTRADAVSAYHRTKWQAEECVRASGLDWTIFRPSLIHGPGGEFMRLIKTFVCGLAPPFIPYFGNGQARVQPVSVKDIAHCVVESLFRSQTIGQVVPMGGTRPFTWLELYDTCRRLMPRSKNWKPYAPLPVPIAKLAALVSAPPMAIAELVVPSLGMFRFDGGQVDMATEDSVCDPAIAEGLFNIKMRSFEDELAAYADGIG